MKSASAGLLVLWLASASLRAATFTVTNTNDSGAGSLRDAMTSAQSCAGGPHTIAFDIAAGMLTNGVAVITPGSALPAVTCSGTTIDGTTQTANVGNTNDVPLGSGGTVGTGPDGVPGTGDEPALLQLNGPEVEIVGSNLSGAILTIQADGVTIAGLSLHGGGDFSGVGTGSGNIDIQSGNGVVIEGNVIGSGATIFANPGGTAQTQNNLIRITGGSNITIQNNLLGFARWRSVLTLNPSIDTVTIEENEFLGSSDGIDYSNTGSGPTGTITITKNLFHDFVVNDYGATIFGAFVTQTGGSSSITNNTFNGLGYGVAIDAARPVLLEHNIIFNNSLSGVSLYVASTSMPTTITQNSIFANAGLGIDLASDGVTPNDPGDGDTGANGLQNFPIIQTVTNGSSTHVTGVFHGAPSTTLDVEFFANGGCSNFPRDFLEGESYLGSSQIDTDASGTASFDVTFPVPTVTGQLVSATATDPSGNTSEFSQRIIFSINPTSGQSAGGAAIAIAGTDFADPTAVTIGGVAVAVTFTDDRNLSTTSPALSPGTVNDVVVTSADGTTGTLMKGWVSDFLDVPAGQQFYTYVTTLVSNAITAGVGGGNYGVDQPTLRQQMAVFLMKAKHGLCFVPPPCTTQVFTDVPCSSGFAPWINEVVAEGVTGGCGNGTTYCPTDPVKRQQMAVLLLKTFGGLGYTPPACVTPTFDDVPCDSPFAPWIYDLVARGITGGCGGGNYCPTLAATRGQMAVFVTKTFNLQ